MAKRVTEKRSVKESQQKKGKGKGQQKQGLGKRFVNFFKRLKNELKKVTWPDRAQLKRTSAVSFAIIICIVLLIFISDSILRGLLSIGGFNDPTEQETAPQAQTTTSGEASEAASTETTVSVTEPADLDKGETTTTAAR